MDGPSITQAFLQCGVSHVIWIPDSELGTWNEALSSTNELKLIRVSREGEAFALAGGLILGGAKPVVVVQCTGFFEAGDSYRNIVHDMKLPVFAVVGLRSYYAHQEGKTADTCPVFAEPIVRAWQVHYQIFDRSHSADDLANAYRLAQQENRPGIALIAE